MESKEKDKEAGKESKREKVGQSYYVGRMSFRHRLLKNKLKDCPGNDFR